jgi:hypothetical protein
MTLDQLKANLAQLGGCGDGGCIIHRRGGQHTNGGCHCDRDRMKMHRIGLWLQAYLKANP